MVNTLCLFLSTLHFYHSSLTIILPLIAMLDGDILNDLNDL